MKWLLVLGLLLTAGAAQADSAASPIDGNKLLARCTSDKPVLSQGCDAYVTGVADAVSDYEMAAKLAKVTRAEDRICVPVGTTGTQLRKTVVDWLQAHPAERGRQAGVTVIHIYRQVYPCH